MEPNPVVHFEMPYEDKNRMAEFYKKAFGWKPQMLGPEMGEYVVMHTTEIDEKTKFPKEPGRINGGFFKMTDDEMSKRPNIVIATDNIQESLQKIKDAGGKVPEGTMDIPGIGTYANIIDTEGNRVAIMQPLPM